MQTILIVIHLMVVLALIGVVLIQRSEDGGLGIGGGGGGGGGFFTARGTANVLTRTTAILALLFFITSMALTIVAGWNRAPRSILLPAGEAPSAPAVPQSGGGSILDQIRKQGGEAAPAAPAPSSTAPSSAAPSSPAPAAPAAPPAPSGPQVPQSQ